MPAITDFKQTMDGAALLADWLGSGGRTVSTSNADIRASACLDCPQHRPGRWWEHVLKDPVADVIRHQLELKQQMNVESSFDDQLFMCRACGCCLRLKVLVPIEHIANHTTPEQLAKYPANCWIPAELDTL